MTDSIVWVTPHIVLNLDALAYVKFSQDGAKVAFSTGDVIELNDRSPRKVCPLASRQVCDRHNA